METDGKTGRKTQKQKDKAQRSTLNTEAQASSGVIKPIVRPNIHDKNRFWQIKTISAKLKL